MSSGSSETTSPVRRRVGIALGSNQGDRGKQLRQAASRLRKLGASDHFLASGIYETAPVDCPPGSPPFHNAVVEIESEDSPIDLLEKLLALEDEMGRPRQRERNAPRVIDLDLLYFGELTLETEKLTLPHPRMAERAFVLAPLAEIRPEFEDQLERLKEPGLIVRLPDSLI